MVHLSRLLARPSAYSDGSQDVPNALGHIARAELLASIGIDVTEVPDDHMRLLKRARTGAPGDFACADLQFAFHEPTLGE